MRRYFEGLLLALLATGFLALASTGRLPWPLEALGVAAFALRTWAFLRSRRVWLPNRIWLAALLLYLPVYVLDGVAVSRNFLDASLHLVVIAGLAKLFAPPSAQDDLLLGLLAFLEVLTAALLTDAGGFLLLLGLFVVVLIAALVAREMAQAEAAGGLSPAAPKPARGGLLWFSLGLSLAVTLSGALIFFLLPRTMAAAWGSRAGARGLSGFSDEVRLGALADVQRSNRTVMHIRIAGASDPPLTPEEVQQLYWRGRALTTFDGQRWYDDDTPSFFATRGGRLEVARPQIEGRARIVRYRVTLEPMNSPVLFFPGRLLWADTRYPVLAWERATATLAGPGHGFAGARYAGASDLSLPGSAALRAAPAPSPRQLRYALAGDVQLPDGLDPRVAALARQIVAHGAADNWDRMRELSDYLQAHYTYTLDNLPQGPDPLSAFLFDRQAGDCEYFATALAVMARTLGIPARVVNGFTAGTFNPLTGDYVVRGSDAHTWVEAYFPVPLRTGRDLERGPRGEWVTFDPTPAALPGAAAGWGGPAMLLDALSSAWQSWVVSYDWWRQARLAGQMQLQVGAGLERAWGAVAAGAGAAWRAWRTAPRGGGGGQAAWPEAAGGALLAGLAALAVAEWQRGRRRQAAGRDGRAAVRRAQRAYRAFQRHLRHAGVARTRAQTGDELLLALAARRPNSPLLEAARAFVAAYQAVRFGPPSTAAAQQLPACLERVRRAV